MVTVTAVGEVTTRLTTLLQCVKTAGTVVAEGCHTVLAPPLPASSDVSVGVT